VNDRGVVDRRDQLWQEVGEILVDPVRELIGCRFFGVRRREGGNRGHAALVAENRVLDKPGLLGKLRCVPLPQGLLQTGKIGWCLIRAHDDVRQIRVLPRNRRATRPGL